MSLYHIENLQNEASLALALNPVLLEKIQKATGLPETQINELLAEVFCFLYLTSVANERLTPSHIVDLAWHELILFTKYYAETSDRLFGKFIHHHPGGDSHENKSGFKKTHYWYNKIFGIQPAPQYWGKIIIEIADESDCGV